MSEMGDAIHNIDEERTIIPSACLLNSEERLPVLYIALTYPSPRASLTYLYRYDDIYVLGDQCLRREYREKSNRYVFRGELM